MSKLQVNDIVDKDDVSAPGFSKGAVITGLCTATTFVGNLTGNVTGNASGVSGSPDITVSNITGGGRVLIGNSSVRTVWGGNTALQIEGLDGATSSASIVRNSNDASYPYLALGKSRGTSDGSSTIVQNNDVTGLISFNAADGGDMNPQTAYIESAVDGSPGVDDMPGRLSFYTTSDGSHSSTERLRIDSNGLVSISPNGLAPSSYGSPSVLVSGDDSALTLMGSGSTNNTSFTGIKFRVAGGSTGDYTKAGIFAQRQAAYNDLDIIFAMDTAADANSVAISDEKVRIKSSGRVGINTAEPFSELHIAASNVAKTWTTYDGTVLTVENYDSDGSIIQMVGRNTAPCGIWFGDEDSKNSGRIRYDHSTDMLSLWASGGQKRLGVGPTLSEKTKVTAGKLSDNTNIDLDYGNVHLFTTAESTTCTPNIRVDSSTTLNSVMEVGETTVVTLITTANASAYCEHITIDGSAVTENWIGGSAPSGGGSSGVDIHSFTIIKTAANTYTVLGNHSKTS